MNGSKQRPTLPPAAPIATELRQALVNAIDDVSQRGDVTVQLKIRGGLPSQRYIFDFSATGEGKAHCSFECALSKRSGRSNEHGVSPNQIQELLKQLPAAVTCSLEGEWFLPDTLLGILDISAGGYSRRFVYAADPEQAKTQGKALPEQLKRVINTIHRIAAKLTGVRSTNP